MNSPKGGFSEPLSQETRPAHDMRQNMEKKKDPFRFLYENRELILKSLNKCSKDVSSAWLFLNNEMPSIRKVIHLDTFRYYVKSLLFLSKKIKLPQFSGHLEKPEVYGLLGACPA